MLKQRIITSLIAAPLAILAFYLGSWPFSITMGLLTLVAWHEYCDMCKVKNLQSFSVSGTLLLLIMLVAAQWGQPHHLIFGVFLTMTVILSFTVLCAPKIVLTDAIYAIFGLIYIGLAFSHFMWLRFLGPEVGMKFFVFAMLGTWACDTFAYFFGTKWGIHKLCPTVSPAKSVEGAVAGFFGCILVVGISGHILSVALPISLITGMIVGTLCQLGDLVESALKRHMGVKDSGCFFPGHGGVLDRVDSLMFSIPAVYYFVLFFV